MALIDNTYFKNDIILPQVGNAYQVGSVDEAIDVYEPEILKKNIGYELYTLMNDAWLDSIKATDPVALPTRFDELINGADFTIDVNGKTVKLHWNGYRNTEKISLISYYTHYKYLNNNESRTSTTGQAKTKKENSVIVSVRRKIIYSHNRMIELYGELPKPSRTTRYAYDQIEEYFLDLDNYERYNLVPSAFNFLLANIDDYPEWIFTPVFKQNVLGI